jgi:hypothetical protein
MECWLELMSLGLKIHLAGMHIEGLVAYVVLHCCSNNLAILVLHKSMILASATGPISYFKEL